MDSLQPARPSVVCLTPVRNEGWILERFLRCVSLWSDWILLADQGSCDETLQIAAQFPKVRVIPNEVDRYDEQFRQKLLIDAARKLVPTPRLLLALDADEAFTANYAGSQEWRTMLAAPPGTVIRFGWVHLLPGCKQAWLSKRRFPWGFMDDGTVHVGTDIHSPRIPVPTHGPEIRCDEIKVLHFQSTDLKRMHSKHRYYQCFERIKKPALSPLRIFDQYHHMERVPPSEIIHVKPEWFGAYQTAGIDMLASPAPSNQLFWWDLQVLEMMKVHGARFFARENIWRDWSVQLQAMGADPTVFGDPRSALEKIVHRFLLSSAHLQNRWWATATKKCLARAGW